jgi:predicted RNase H-like nuclease
MPEMLFTGFDSAWGGKQLGAICDLSCDSQTESCDLFIQRKPEQVNWSQAVDRIQTAYRSAKNHVIAIDQGLVVPNREGQRPVERMLAQALMKDFQCGAHSSNTSNLSCYGPEAGIWAFLEALDHAGYQHNPMAVAQRQEGKFYFECYPHPALIGLFDLDAVLLYKVRKKNVEAWSRLLNLLLSLNKCQPRLVNVADFVTDLPQTKQNEDLLDSVIAAYVAAYFWYHGTKKSTILGSLDKGYIVTPHGIRTKERFDKTFPGEQVNQTGTALAQRPEPTSIPLRKGAAVVAVPAPEPVLPLSRPLENREGWSAPVNMVCNDTRGNLWCRPNTWMIRDRCEGYDLLVKLIEEDGEPELKFVPFRAQGVYLGGVKISEDLEQRELWMLITAGATTNNPLQYPVIYRYTTTGRP